VGNGSGFLGGIDFNEFVALGRNLDAQRVGVRPFVRGDSAKWVGEPGIEAKSVGDKFEFAVDGV